VPDRWVDRQRDRQTDRPTDGETCEQIRQQNDLFASVEESLV